jgi:hypothetical protein
MYYLAQVEGLQFVIYDREQEGLHKISIVDKKGEDCIFLHDLPGNDPTDLILSGLSYKPICTVGDPMKRGRETRLMIKTILFFCMQKYETYQTVSFKDDTSFDCRIVQDMTIQIPMDVYNIILYGKTWYQRYFGAIPIYDDHARKLQESHDLLQHSINIPFEKFWKDATMRTGMHNIVSRFPDIKSNISILYVALKETGETWQKLFYNLFSVESDAYVCNKYGTTLPCIIYIELSDYILNNFIKFMHGIDMVIPRSTIEAYDINPVFQETIDPPHMKTVYSYNYFADELQQLRNELGENYSNENISAFYNNTEYNDADTDVPSGGTRKYRKYKRATRNTLHLSFPKRLRTNKPTRRRRRRHPKN